MVIKAKNTDDQITVQNYFYSDGQGDYRIDLIKFDDNKTLSVEEIKLLVLEGTSENDYLSAYQIGSQIHGLDGDDFIDGANGQDTLYGDGGNDRLSGGANDDTLEGWYRQ